MDSVVEILHLHNLRGTPARIAVLGAIVTSDRPLSEAEIKEKIQAVDRSTFYRSIRTLLETKIIQGIITREKIVKYSALHNDKEKGEPAVQFYCTECYCMTDLESKSQLPPVPEGYKEETCRITITGVCKSCNSSQEKLIREN